MTIKIQTIEVKGERFALVPEPEFARMAEAMDILADSRALAAAVADTKPEDFLSDAELGRILKGESALRVWRAHRGLTLQTLADRAGLSKAYLSQLETGEREGTVATYRKLADALSLLIDDIVGSG